MSLHPCYHGRHRAHLCHFGGVLVPRSRRWRGCHGSRSQSRCFALRPIPPNLEGERGEEVRTWRRGSGQLILITTWRLLHYEYALLILYTTVNVFDRMAVLLPCMHTGCVCVHMAYEHMCIRLCLYWLMPAAKPFEDSYYGNFINASMRLEPRRTS